MFPEVQLEMEHVEQEVLGDVFLHPQFFAFRDNSSRFSVLPPSLPLLPLLISPQLLVLFRDVTNMTEQRSASLQVFTQTVHFRLHFGASKGGQQRDQLVAAWHSQPLHVGPTDLTEISMEFTLQSAANIRNLSSEPPLEYEVTQRRLELAWDRFWTSERPFGVPLLRALSLQNYMRQGVPDSKRGLLWQILSGSYALRLLLGTGYYKKLLDDNAETPSVAREEIDKVPLLLIIFFLLISSQDVHRSFPTHPYFQAGAPGPAALRRVLLAFAFHNETIGYCQSMNILAATFLLFMPEESVFFLLVSVCEVLMPGYYNRAMVGSLVDVNLFQGPPFLLLAPLPSLLTCQTCSRISCLRSRTTCIASTCPSRRSPCPGCSASTLATCQRRCRSRSWTSSSSKALTSCSASASPSSPSSSRKSSSSRRATPSWS